MLELGVEVVLMKGDIDLFNGILGFLIILALVYIIFFFATLGSITALELLGVIK
jgi:hypothetical protein